MAVRAGPATGDPSTLQEGAHTGRLLGTPFHKPDTQGTVLPLAARCHRLDLAGLPQEPSLG